MSVDRRDRTRQILVVIGAATAILGAAWGSGALGGTPIDEAAGGALGPDATLLAPAGPAFRIWWAIYLGLAAFAVVQALPSRAPSGRYRAVAWWVLASMLLNGAWIAVVQAGWLWVSVLVLLAIVTVLVIAARRLGAVRDSNRLDRVVTEVTVGLYLGWSLVASAANLAAALDVHSDGVAIAFIALVLGAAMLLVTRLRSRSTAVSLALAAAWGLAWIGVARLDDPPSTAVAVTAFAASALVAIAAVWRLLDKREART